MERPECRKMRAVCRNKSQNRCESLPGFRETMGAWLLSYRLCYDGKHANVSDVSRWVEVKR